MPSEQSNDIALTLCPACCMPWQSNEEEARGLCDECEIEKKQQAERSDDRPQTPILQRLGEWLVLLLGAGFLIFVLVISARRI